VAAGKDSSVFHCLGQGNISVLCKIKHR